MKKGYIRVAWRRGTGHPQNRDREAARVIGEETGSPQMRALYAEVSRFAARRAITAVADAYARDHSKNGKPKRRPPWRKPRKVLVYDF